MTTPPTPEALLISSLSLRVTTLERQVTELLALNATLASQVKWFKEQLFGAKSEKRLSAGSDTQLALPLGGESSLPVPPVVERQEIPAHTRATSIKRELPSNAGVSGLRFDDTVTVEVIECPLPKECQGLSEEEYTILGYEEVDKLCQRRSSYFVRRYRRPKVAVKEKVVASPSPESPVLPGTYADVSFLAGILVDKCLYGLPLYRIHQRLTQGGIHISRATLTHYVHSLGDLVQPVVQVLLEQVLASHILAMDETPIKAGVDKEKRRMKSGYLWPLYGDCDEMVFLFHASRGHSIVESILGKGFKGTLLTDDYGAYKKYAQKWGIVHALCYAHTRRMFLAAEEVSPKEVEVALSFFKKLYAIEALLKGASPERILDTRTKESLPLIDNFFSWIKDISSTLLPKEPLAKACAYALDNEKELRVCLTNPLLSLDTNHVERGNKVVAIGRKNFLFCFSEIGAEYMGLFYSLLYTARLQQINPFDYLCDILPRIRSCPTNDLYSLTPRGWKLAQEHKDSTLIVA